MGWKVMFVAIVGLLIIGIVGYAKAYPVGGARITLVDTNGNPLTDHGKVYYEVWTFDENGSVKVLSRGTLERHFIFSNNILKLSPVDFKRAKELARRRGSKTAFIGVDVWVVKGGKVYTLPPESFETGLSENIFAERVKLNVELKEARVHTISEEIKSRDGITPQISGHWYEWRTVPGGDNSYSNVVIPILIIHNKAGSSVFGTADVAVEVKKYWGPDVTVAFGDKISEKASFDPNSITVKVLGRSTTDYYAGGDDITVPSNSWGYVWLKGTVHYIHQKEYSCYTGLGCFETGNERYFAKIDGFTVDRTTGNVKHIESGSSLGKPPHNFPEKLMSKSRGIKGAVDKPVSISEFYGTIYAGTDGHSFGVGVPVGAILEALSGGKLPPWFSVITVGFSTSDYASYVMLGHVKNKGPRSSVTFYAMESNYKVEIPVKHRPRTGYEKVNVPVGLYIEVDS